FNKLTALFADSELRSEQSLSCSRPETDDNFWLNQSDFSLEPRTAGSNLTCVRFFVNATLSARLPFEVLDYVSDVSLRTIDAGFGQRIVKQTPGGADKRFARQIFFVAGLFADKDDFGATGSFAKYRLRAALPKIAGFAIGRGVAKSR